ncbi:MAG: hypothetical protein ACMUIG_01580 [Thermoplasmatota archaeon]
MTSMKTGSNLAIAVVIMTTLITLGCLDGSDDAFDPAGSEVEMQISSSKIPLDEGQTGEMSIPYIGVNFVELDVKHHFDMPENITRIMVNVSWTGADWDLVLSTGTGDCPHSGVEMNSTRGSGRFLSVEYSCDDGLSEEQWFCHLALDDPGSHRGESISYVFDVTLYSYQEIECDDGVCPV